MGPSTCRRNVGGIPAEREQGEPESIPAFLKLLDPKLTAQFVLAHQVNRRPVLSTCKTMIAYASSLRSCVHCINELG